MKLLASWQLSLGLEVTIVVRFLNQNLMQVRGYLKLPVVVMDEPLLIQIMDNYFSAFG